MSPEKPTPSIVVPCPSCLRIVRLPCLQPLAEGIGHWEGVCRGCRHFVLVSASPPAPDPLPAGTA